VAGYAALFREDLFALAGVARYRQRAE